MSDDRPAKRARGSYAKLICLCCRERRIKCILRDDGTVKPSSDPQPPETACQRCQQQGLECIVRKTTLGRPSLKRPAATTPPSTIDTRQDFTRSPSPCAEDLVLLALDGGSGPPNKRAATLRERPTGVQLAGAIFKTFDLTSQLLARDRRFGSAIAGIKASMPPKIEEVIDQEMLQLLDEHLVWHRLYMPWLPNLLPLYDEVCHSDPESGTSLSATLLLALLMSIALDVPSSRIAPEKREIQHDLRCIIYHTGQKVLFSLPRHQYTLDSLELVHGYRPLSLIHSQEAAAHTLSGKLYHTLANAIAYQLGLNSAAAKLRLCLSGSLNDSIQTAVLDTLRWCKADLMFHLTLDVEEAEGTRADGDQLENDLEQALQSVAEAINGGFVSTEPFFLFHCLRNRADDLFSIRSLTKHWKDLPKLASIVNEHAALREQRKKYFVQGLSQLFYSHGRTEEALALSQLSDMELNQGRTNVIGLALFFAIVSGGKTSGKSKDGHNRMVHLSKYYTEALNREISNTDGSGVLDFLSQFGDAHIEGLERRLTDFINAASDVQLNNISFVGPPRHTTSNILLACKEIAENNAVRIRLDGELHCRVDMQLILFQEAARKLEAMEADGTTQEAVASGSIFAASAKLIRSLHRIMSQWKRNYISKQQVPQDLQSLESSDRNTPASYNTPLPTYPSVFDTSALSAEHFFNDWENWPQLDATELSGMFTYDI